MKKYGFGFLIIATLLACLTSARATTIVWTNTMGGNWSGETNWSPNIVPSENDDVYISADGTYNVSLDTSTTVNSLVIGGGAGAQTFHTGTSVIGVNGACVVNGDGVFDLEGGSLLGPGALTVYGTFNWDGGSLGNGGSVSVAPGGLMVLVAGNDALYGALTNAGAIVLTGGNLQLLGACFDNTGMLVNLTNGLVDFQGDASIFALCGTESVSNYGTVRKEGTYGISDITAPFYNMGTLDVESGTVSLDSTYGLTNGNINFGISSLYDYGTLNLSGDPAQLAGTVSASLIGDYQPIATNEFPVVTYASESGEFSNTNLPYADAWTTNYSKWSFNLVVLNARPIMAAIPNQIVGEFSTLTISANATDADIPAQTLTYSLSNAPAGMTVDPVSGVVTWAPAQTQSPSTNLVTVAVTDNGTPELSASTNFEVVVREVNVAPVLPAIGIQTVNDSSLLVVNDSAKETNIHASITGYSLISPPAGAKISSKGMVSWTPNPAQGPSTNTFISVVTNSDPLAMRNPIVLTTNSFTVIVFAPTLAPIPNYSINVGQALTFAGIAADNDPTRTLTFNLVSGPPSASVGSSSGIFSWRPGTTDAGTTNTVTLRVTDNNVPPLTASQTFTINVGTLSEPTTLGAARVSEGQVQFDINGPVGPEYIIQAADGLPAAQWTTIQTITPTTTPFTFSETNSGSPGRFYRVLLSP